MGRVRSIVPVVAALLVAVTGKDALGQAYPSRPIRMLTAGFGGGSDLAARILAQELSASLGQQVVVDSRVGGVIIGEIAAKAPADGYTLLTYSNSLWLIPLMRTRTSYDPVEDFAPISLIGKSAMVLVTHPAVPASSVRDLIALARAKPRSLSYASGPAGAVPHLAGELFKSMARVDIVHVAYKSVGAGVTDLLGARVELMFPNANAALPNAAAGKLRALAITSAEPSPFAPGLPTLAQSGLAGYECVALYAVMAPARTPGAIIARLHDEITGILKRPAIRERFSAASADVVAGSPQMLAAHITAEMKRIGKVVADAGIRIE